MNDHVLIFHLQGRLCALPLAQVERVVQAVAVTPLTMPESWNATFNTSTLCGVINVHGEIVPVFDLRARSHATPITAQSNTALPPMAQLDDQMILVSLKDRRRAALLCDKVETVREIPPQALASARALLPGALGSAAHGGIIKDEAGLIHLQDLEALLVRSDGAVEALLEQTT